MLIALVTLYRSANAGALRSCAYRGMAIGEIAAQKIASAHFRKAFTVWKARARAPRRLSEAMAAPLSRRFAWSLRGLQAAALRRGRVILQAFSFEAACRRHRLGRLRYFFSSWSVGYCQAERLHGRQSQSLAKRTGLRLCRNAWKSWSLLFEYSRVLLRFGSVLRRARQSLGLSAWRSHAARCGGGAEAAAQGRAVMQRALKRQKEECERLVELRCRENATRTAKALMHSWRCASAADRAHQAQRRCAAHALLRSLAMLERQTRYMALVRWRASADTNGTQVAAATSIAAVSRAEKLERIRHGGLILQSLLHHRQRLMLCRAINGNWRLLHWQAMVRSFDASATREQRRYRAECDSLRIQLAASEQEALRLSSLEVGEAERSDQTREEANAIIMAVRKERAAQVEALRQSQDVEAALKDDMDQLTNELHQAQARLHDFENERRVMASEVGYLRQELQESRINLEQTSKAELHRERLFSQQAQVLQQMALTSGHEARDAEREIRERAEKMERQVEERAHNSEKLLEQMLEEKTRAVELQASIAEEQERNIRHLENLLKEQGDELRRSQLDHSRGLDQFRASTSLTESRSCLLQEQVVALRQQLQREHAELKASERAWAGDRAALLSAVANSTQSPTQPRSQSASRRKADSTLALAGRCPWHSRGPSSRPAPALM